MDDVQKIVSRLRPIDDIFFQKLVEDKGFCEELLQVIMNDKGLKLIKCEPQKNLRNVAGRSVILDALCQTSDRRFINIEVQKSNDDNHQKRVRYNGSNIDTYITEKGIKFNQLPDVYVIYISSFDIFKASHVIYHVDRVVRETSQVVDNGFHEIYVNTKVDDGSEISGLMQLFNKSSIPDDKRYPNVCNAIRSFKEGKGENNMCEEVERYAQQYAQHAVAVEREKTEKEREKAEKEREKAEKERKKAEKEHEQAIANIVSVYRQTDSPIDTAIKNIMKMYDYSEKNATEIVEKYWDRQ